jgi:hypothetical protein
MNNDYNFLFRGPTEQNNRSSTNAVSVRSNTAVSSAEVSDAQVKEVIVCWFHSCMKVYVLNNIIDTYSCCVCRADRCHQVLEDEELRSMLMDPELQRILMECGDPVKFQQHMANPTTAKKINKLYAAGLVGTAN